MARGTDRPDTPSASQPDQGPVAPRRRGPRSGIGLFLLLVVFWFLLSGRVGLQYFIFMFVSIAIVMALNPERPFGGQDPSRDRGLLGRLQATGFIFRYLGWLIWSVVKANVDVAYRILHPSLPIQPMLMGFDTELEEEVAQVLVANTITLTPGTVTIDLLDGRYLVHALHPDTAQALTSGELQNVVGPIFGDGPDPVPQVRWGRTVNEVMP